MATNYVLDEDNFNQPKPTSILLLGSDAEQPSSIESGTARTDVMIVATINPQNDAGNIEINTVSIPRDVLMLNTCSQEYSKANEIFSYAYTSDGIDAAIDCTKSSIEQFLNIPIDYYVETSFSGLINIVDGIGGIEIDVDYDFCEQDAAGNPCAIEFKQGRQLLDGEEALAYARQRKYSSDYERNLRQQQVIGAIISKILANPSEYLSTFIDIYQENLHTNLNAQDLLAYTNALLTFFNNMMVNLSSNSPLIVDIKTAPTSNVTSIGTGSDVILGVDLNNIAEQTYFDMYGINQEHIDDELYQELLKITTVQELYLSRKSTKFPSNKSIDQQGNPIVKEDTQNIIEIQNYSIKVEDINEEYGFYSYVSPYSLNYTSNMLRISLGLSPELNLFDYSIVSEFGGPSVATIIRLDEINFEVDLSGLYLKYDVSEIIYDPSSTQVNEVYCGNNQNPIDSDFDGYIDTCEDIVTQEVEQIVCSDTQQLVDNQCVDIEQQIEEVICTDQQIAQDLNNDGIIDNCLSPPPALQCNDGEESTLVEGEVDENGFPLYICKPIGE